MAVRLFTLEDANELVPRLNHEWGRVAMARQRAVELAGQLGGLQRAVELLRGAPVPRGLEHVVDAFAQSTAEMTAALERINALGCLIRDVELGMVDFPSQMGGETVHLCWQYGEPSVYHLHGPDEDERRRRAVAAPGETANVH